MKTDAVDRAASPLAAVGARGATRPTHFRGDLPFRSAPGRPARPQADLRRLCLLAVLALGCARADVPAETLSRTLQANQEAVLFLGGSLRYHCGRCTKDHDLRVLGTAIVVDGRGLLLTARMGALADPKSEIKESHLHVVTPDGAEVPVRVTVTDHELGVLMLSVDKPEDVQAHGFKHLNLETAAPAKTLDELVVLRRFDQRLGYPVQAFAVRVSAIDTKPRITYLSADFPGNDMPLAPCFSTGGQLVGFYSGGESVLAAEEFLDLVNQARNRAAR